MDNEKKKDTNMTLIDFVKAYLSLDDEKKNIVKTMLMNEQKGGDDDDAD